MLELLRAGNRRVKSVWLSNQLDPDDTISEIEEGIGFAEQVGEFGRSQR